MKNSTLKKTLSSPWATPILLLVITTLTFGPFIHRLGFYQDDWNIIYIYNLKGNAGIWEYYFSDGRPLTAFLLTPLFRINGINPLSWQITAVLLRCMTACLFWLCLGQIWPSHKKLSIWAALLFLVYPYFNLQPMAAIYSPHWLGYLSFFASLYFLIQAVKGKNRRVLYMILSVFISVMGLITIEYFAGVELLKLYVIWLVLAQSQDPEIDNNHFLEAIKLYLPSFFVLAAFLYYRLIWITSVTPRGISPKLASEFSSKPISAIFGLGNIMLQDTVGLLAAKWAETFLPERFDLQVSTNRNILIIVLVSAAVTYLFLKYSVKKYQRPSPASNSFGKHILLFSGAAILLGQLPAWGIGWHITAKNPLWNSRLGLPAVFGLALLGAYLVQKLVAKEGYRIVIITMMVSLSISWQLHNTNAFKNSWQTQRDFFRQLLWRAPEIQPNTVISSKGEFLSFVGGYPLSFAINTIYDVPEKNGEIPYWYVDVEDLSANIDRFQAGIPVDREYYTSEFHGNSNRNLSLYWHGDDKHCLWMLRPQLQHQHLPSLPDEAQALARASDMNRIISDSQNTDEVYSSIFRKEHLAQSSWCFFYQKAELARQTQDWGEIIELWQQAEEEGFRAQNGIELLPFIEGFAYQGAWQKSAQLTKRANQLTLGMDSVFCPLWKEIDASTSNSDTKSEILNSVAALLKCAF